VEPGEVVRVRAVGRIRAILAILVVLLLLIAVRGAQLCVAPSERTLRAAAVQRWDQVTLRARRGEVLDRHGRRLATSVATPNVVVDPLRVLPSEIEELARIAARIVGGDEAEIAEKMRRDESRYQRIAVKVHPAVAEAIEALDHPALWVEREPRRYYPEETLAAQVIGFVDAAGSGREGIEAALDTHLRGGSVLLQRRRDRRGLDVDDPTRAAGLHVGGDVHLTIDRTIQRIAERALEAIVVESAPLAASAVVIDVPTGDILALANVPAFNPNDLAGDAAPRKNHVVQDAIEPGSVFKPFTIAAVMEAGLVHPESTIDCEGGTWMLGRTSIRDDHPHGVLTIREVLKFSSNIASAKLAIELGAERFFESLGRFGFAARTGIELPGERAGMLRDPRTVRPIELATTAYGQGVTATPLQLAMALGALGNGGVRMEPRLVVRVEDMYGVPEWVKSPEVAGRAVSEATARQVVDMMVSVTEPGGTATRARVPGFPVAGKTGTAEKVQNGRYTDARIGSFAGLVPADDPRLAIVVTVDEPTIGSRYGGIVAAPAFAAIAGETLRVLGVQPSTDRAGSGQLAAGSGPPPPDVVLSWEGSSWTLPDLTGRTMREVATSLAPAGIALNMVGSGRVVSQDPPPGASVPSGTTVSVALN
jgi:cell division protein FtsI (penicillin-binding protein 3)